MYSDMTLLDRLLEERDRNELNMALIDDAQRIVKMAGKKKDTFIFTRVLTAKREK